VGKNQVQREWERSNAKDEKETCIVL
jgi:hypothetical protein